MERTSEDKERKKKIHDEVCSQHKLYNGDINIHFCLINLGSISWEVAETAKVG